MTWNVNGIRALTQYHPYCDDLHKNYREILDFLDADVICLQETKITRSKLDTDLALVPGYDSYWSFHRTKSGYSGVAIYIKDHIKLLAAEEGISGILSGNISLLTATPPGSNGSSPSISRSTSMLSTTENDPRKRGVGGYPSLEGDGAAAFSRFQELDTEGRGLVLDFGFFVLFNLYCPNETDDTRLPFKMDYYHLLEARVRELIGEGREVIVMGDMNVIPTELDHCDPAKWKKESGEDDFTNTQPRKWFNSFLAPNGPMTDLYRIFHAGEVGAFTCWNTKINARPSNYGTRLDYILVTNGLVPWFKSCDRKPQIVGSDHCPVVAEMFTELALEKSEEEQALQQETKAVQSLQDILDSHGGTTDHTLAAKFFDEFSGKQQKLSDFFKKPSQLSTPGTTSSPSPPTAGDAKRPAATAALADSDQRGPRKRAFFSSENKDSIISASETPSTLNSQPISTTKISSSSLLSPINVIPKPSNKTAVKTAVSRTGQDKGSSKKTSMPSKAGGQQSVLSFFTSPSPQAAKESATTTTTTTRLAPEATLDVEMSGQDTSIVPDAPQATEPSEQSSPLSSLASTSESTNISSVSSSFSPSDFADWIPGSQDVLPFSMNGEATTSKWQSLFSPKVIPKCRYHNVPCTEYTVNKKGPNKGRRFFLCSMPVGPEGNSIGQNPEYRCNYFEWLNPDRKK
ncbi:Class II abasic (AP) endonuclease [Mortierella sp. GBA30]|nr:Class II abasic (AP) endonuclease [Mortierella sp. GBA30]